MSQKHEKRLMCAQEKEVIKSAKPAQNAQDEKNLAEERLLAMDRYIHNLENRFCKFKASQRRGILKTIDVTVRSIDATL